MFFDAVLHTPFFAITLSVVAFSAGCIINKRFRSPILNPLVIALIIIALILSLSGISPAEFSENADAISLLLLPATVSLALLIYRKRALLKKYLLPVIAGCLCASLSSVFSVIILCKIFSLDEKLTASLIPKSVTTPIAMEICGNLSGIVPVTVAAVIFTGILGALFSPLLIRIFKVNDPVIQGLAIGSSSHAIGTSKAVELGEIQGAMSGIAICISGILTVLISMFL